MIGVVLCVGHDVIRKASRHIVLKIEHGINEAIKPSLRELHIAMIGQHNGFSEQTRTHGNAGRIELWKMQLHYIMLPDQFRGNQPKCGSDHAFADTRDHGNANHLHPIHHLFKRQGWIVVGGHHGHFMAAFDKGTCKALGINSQS